MARQAEAGAAGAEAMRCGLRRKTEIGPGAAGGRGGPGGPGGGHGDIGSPLPRLLQIRTATPSPCPEHPGWDLLGVQSKGRGRGLGYNEPPAPLPRVGPGSSPGRKGLGRRNLEEGGAGYPPLRCPGRGRERRCTLRRTLRQLPVRALPLTLLFHPYPFPPGMNARMPSKSSSRHGRKRLCT
jgi:hypothetical protein